MDEEIQPWEHQPGESNKAFQAFQMYLNLGYKRSVPKVQIMLGVKSKTYLFEWSTKFNWQLRVKAWENEQVRMQNEAAKVLFKEMAEKHLKQADAFIELIKLPATIISKKLKRDENGKIVIPKDLEDLSTVELFNLMLSTINSFGNLVRIERLSVGIPTEISQSDNNVNIRSNNLYGDKVANNPDATKAITDLLNAMVANPKNGKPVNNGLPSN